MKKYYDKPICQHIDNSYSTNTLRQLLMELANVDFEKHNLNTGCNHSEII